jgi:arylsulfatase A-like enzyme
MVQAMTFTTLLALLFLVDAKPNILIILADDQGYGDIGYNAPLAIQPGAGGKVYTPNPPRTPFLDSLAASPHTLVFDRFWRGKV